MDKKELRALKKLQKKVARLCKKDKHGEALELQREICDKLSRETYQWQLLADIAKRAGQLRLSLAARFEAAKIDRAGPDEWLALAEEALEWGFGADSLEARFRAADGCAVAGDFRQALALLEEVLSVEPNHRQALRIRRLVSARLPADEPTGVSGGPTEIDTNARTAALDGADEPEEMSAIRDTMSYVEQAEITHVPTVAGQDELLLEEVTSPGWEDPQADGGGEHDPTPAGYVCQLQPWPSVLDNRTLTFIGSNELLGEELSGLTQTALIAEGTPVYLQGHAGQLLYCLDSGTVAFSRERGDAHQLGEITPGHMFGELGALVGLPSTATATALESSLLRVVSRKQIQQQVEQTNQVPPLISMLRSWYLETVLRICPLFLGGDEPTWPEGDDIDWVTARPGDQLVGAGESGPLCAIVTGFAKVIYPSETKTSVLGYLCPGDLAGELDPSPVMIVAESMVTALRLPRSFTDNLAAEAQVALDERRNLCQAAVEIPPGSVGQVIVADEVTGPTPQTAAGQIEAGQIEADADDEVDEDDTAVIEDGAGPTETGSESSSRPSREITPASLGEGDEDGEDER